VRVPPTLAAAVDTQFVMKRSVKDEKRDSPPTTLQPLGNARVG
jgi:hypothetical protein